MVTGNPAYSGTSKASLIANILEHQPKRVSELKTNVPAALEHMIEKCLAKNPEERCESAHDVAEELRWIRDVDVSPRRIAPSRSSQIVAAALAVALIGVVSFVVWRTRHMPRPSAVHLSIPLDNAVGTNAPRFLNTAWGPSSVAISPDGKHVVYCVMGDGLRRLILRNLENFESISVASTETAWGPFFSPDGQWIGFSAWGSLNKIPIGGGATQIIFRGLRGGGGGSTWAADGVIYFSISSASGGGLWKVPANGGRAVPITKPNLSAGEVNHSWPTMLPDGKHILFTIRTDAIDSMDDAKIAVLSLDTGKWRVILEGGTDARYVSGQIIFGRNGALYAAPFDLKTLSVTGTPTRVLSDVLVHPAFGAAHYDVSATGNLVYAPGGTNTAQT